MLKESHFLLMSILLCFGCGRSLSEDGFITLKPGQFCQLGAVATVGDTLFVAGSYVAHENPNVSVQPVRSYLAAVDGSGRLLWELKGDAPDYIRWTHLQIALGDRLYVAGIMDSPLEGYAVVMREIVQSTGEVAYTHRIDKPSMPRIQHIQASGQNVALLRTQADNPPCIHLQLLLPGFAGTDVTTYCGETAAQVAKLAPNTLDCYVARGNDAFTQQLYFYPGTDTVGIQMPLPEGFKLVLVNDLAVIGPQRLWAATTIKNAQGPCVWQLGTDRADFGLTCLEHWPFHGNAKLLAYGDCAIVAFNASSEASEHNAHVAMINSGMETVWQQTIASQHPFIIQHLALSGSNLHVAGTLEMGTEGSALAVKTLALPECK